MKGKRVMVVAAHPDDADFYGGGTIAGWIEKGAEVKYLICTDGALGSEDGKTSPEDLKKLREKEQNDANKALGVLETEYLGFRDMSLEVTDELREKISKSYRSFKPHILVTFDPWVRYELHPDHTAAGKAAIYARLAAKMPLQYPDQIKDGFGAWSIQELYMFKTDRPDYWVEIGDWFEKKLKALACHASQFGAFLGDEEYGRKILEELSDTHPETGKPAEGFRRLPLEGIEGLKTYIGLTTRK